VSTRVHDLARREGRRAAATGAVALVVALVTSAVPAACAATQQRSPQSAARDGVVVLVATATVRANITLAFEHHADVLPGDAEIVLHSLYLARSPSAATSWAVAQFEPTKRAVAQGQSMGPPFANSALPSRPDPVVAITGSAVTLAEPKGRPWAVVAQGGVDWPCQGALPSSVWAAWRLKRSVLCRAEHAAPLRVSLPNGGYFGYITAVETQSGGGGAAVIFDPETISPDGLSVSDLYPYTYRLGVGAYTTAEASEGFNAAAAHTYDVPWSELVPQLTATNTPNTLTGAPWEYSVAVTRGRATFVKQFSNITPYCALSETDEPTSPSDRSPVTVPPPC